MTRQEENRELIRELKKNPYTTIEAYKLAYLGDISISLAVIADALSAPTFVELPKKGTSEAADEAYAKIMSGDFSGGGHIAPDNSQGWRYEKGGGTDATN